VKAPHPLLLNRLESFPGKLAGGFPVSSRRFPKDRYLTSNSSVLIVPCQARKTGGKKKGKKEEQKSSKQG